VAFPPVRNGDPGTGIKDPSAATENAETVFGEEKLLEPLLVYTKLCVDQKLCVCATRGKTAANTTATHNHTRCTHVERFIRETLFSFYSAQENLPMRYFGVYSEISVKSAVFLREPPESRAANAAFASRLVPYCRLFVAVKIQPQRDPGLSPEP
jgi:hypothetical protein